MTVNLMALAYLESLLTGERSSEPVSIVSLSDHGLGDITGLLPMLEEMRGMTHFNLKGNRLVKLPKDLSGLKALISLDLREQQGSLSVANAVQGLASLPRLEQLWLDPPISSADLQLLTACLPRLQMLNGLGCRDAVTRSEPNAGDECVSARVTPDQKDAVGINDRQGVREHGEVHTLQAQGAREQAMVDSGSIHSRRGYTPHTLRQSVPQTVDSPSPHVKGGQLRPALPRSIPVAGIASSVSEEDLEAIALMYDAVKTHYGAQLTPEVDAAMTRAFDAHVTSVLTELEAALGSRVDPFLRGCEVLHAKRRLLGLVSGALEDLLRGDPQRGAGHSFLASETQHAASTASANVSLGAGVRREVARLLGRVRSASDGLLSASLSWVRELHSFHSTAHAEALAAGKGVRRERDATAVDLRALRAEYEAQQRELAGLRSEHAACAGVMRAVQRERSAREEVEGLQRARGRDSLAASTPARPPAEEASQMLTSTFPAARRRPSLSQASAAAVSRFSSLERLLHPQHSAPSAPVSARSDISLPATWREPPSASGARDASVLTPQPHHQAPGAPSLLPLASVRATLTALYASRQVEASRWGSGCAPSTLEEHVYAFAAGACGGSRPLVAYFATSLLASASAFAPFDAHCAAFAAVVRNAVDEGFLATAGQVEGTARALLRLYAAQEEEGGEGRAEQAMAARTGTPDGTVDAAAATLVPLLPPVVGSGAPSGGPAGVDEPAWGFIVRYMFGPTDATAVSKLVWDACATATVAAAFPLGPAAEAAAVASARTFTGAAPGDDRPAAALELARARAAHAERVLSGMRAAPPSQPVASAGDSRELRAFMVAANPASALPWAHFIDVILRYQLVAHSRFLSGFVALFTTLDPQASGYVDAQGFARLAAAVQPDMAPKEVAAMFGPHQRLPFTECVRLLTSGAHIEASASAAQAALASARGQHDSRVGRGPPKPMKEPPTLTRTGRLVPGVRQGLGIRKGLPDDAGHTYAPATGYAAPTTASKSRAQTLTISSYSACCD